MQPLQGSVSGNLRGTVCVPGDKSISHRALMLCGLAVGNSTISGLLKSEDVLHTRSAMQALGATITELADGRMSIRGTGVAGLQQPDEALYFGNSGTGVRLAAGLMASSPITVDLIGDASLSKRPMRRVIDPLLKFGARFCPQGQDRLPLQLIGAHHPVPVSYRLPVASAQVKSAVLLAGLNTPGVTEVIEPVATRDHTERMLQGFGAELHSQPGSGGTRIRLTGQRELVSQDVTVPGDPSSAAFAIVAALITEGSEIAIENVLLNPTRIGLLTTLQEMGGDIEISGRAMSGGEETGTIHVRSSRLKGAEVPAARAPSMIDEYPVLAVAAACADGETHMAGLGELRVKESDRLAAIAGGLAANGVDVRTGEDWLAVTGGKVPGGGLVATHLDHRIAMAFCVLGLVSAKPVRIDDGRIIATSFPEFVELMRGLGAAIEEVAA